MTDIQYTQLIENLNKATVSGKLKWSISNNDSTEFYAVINNCKITISVYYNSISKSNIAELKLFNEDGNVIREYKYYESSKKEKYDEIDILYDLVDDRYFMRSETENSIMKGLEEMLG